MVSSSKLGSGTPRGFVPQDLKEEERAYQRLLLKTEERLYILLTSMKQIVSVLSSPPLYCGGAGTIVYGFALGW